MNPRDFQEAERSGRRPLERHGRNKRRLPFASAEKLVNRHLALTEAAGKHHGSVECEQRRGEISVGTWREQVAADRGRLSYGRTTDRARCRMQKGKLAFGKYGRHGGAGAELDPSR